MCLSCRVILPAVGELGFFKLVFGGALVGDAVGERLGFIQSAAEKARRVEIEIEQIVLGFAVVRVEGDGFLKTLSGFGCMDAAVSQPLVSARRPQARPSQSSYSELAGEIATAFSKDSMAFL